MEWKNRRCEWEKKKQKWLRVSNALDSQGAFLELHEIEPSGELQGTIFIKIYLKSLVPQNDPPELDKLSWLQKIFHRDPVDVDGAFILKWGDLTFKPFLQLR